MVVVAAVLVVSQVALPRRVPAGELAFGLVLGSITALLAIGLVLVYRTNRIINFALADIGVFGALLFENLIRAAHIPWLLALPAGLIAGAGLGALIEYGVIRRFRRAPRLILTVATIGVAEVVTFLSVALVLAFGSFAATGDLRTPLTHLHFAITGHVFYGDAILLFGAVPLVVFGLEAFFRRTRYGVAVRASAENAERATLLGVPVRQVSTVSWALAGGLAALATMLRAPVVGLITGGASSVNTILLRALAAAVIGRMENLGVTVIAALGLGVIDNALTYAYSGSTISDPLFVLLIVTVLLCQRPRATRSEQGLAQSWTAIEEVRPIPRELKRLREVRGLRFGLGLVVAGALAGLPFLLSPSRDNLYSLVCIYAIAAVSLVILTGWSGQISLGQFGLVGLGAAVAGRLAADAHWHFILAMSGAAVAAAAASVVLGLAALRVRGYFFAVTTLGFAVAVPSFFLNRRFFSGLLPVHRPSRPKLIFDFEGERAFALFCLVVLALVILAVRTLRRSRTGRVLIAVRDSDRAAQSFGVNRIRAQLLTFGLSGAIAGIAGSLFAFQQHAVSGTTFTAEESLRVFAMAVIGGLGSLPGVVLGAAAIRGGASFLPGQLALLTTGLGLLVVLLVLPGGLGHLVYRLRDIGLRRIAVRRHLVVPSLVADRRQAEAVETEGVELAYQARLTGTGGGRG